MKSLGWKPLLSCVAALVAITAFARADVFGLGDGHDETLRIPAGQSQTINRYAAVVAPVRKGDREVRVDALAGFADGDLVMVLQATGVGPLAAPSNAVFSFSPFELNPVGHWELARVERARGRTLTFGRPLQEDFTPPHAQVIRVPELRDVTIEPGGELRARPWNGSTGGVVAFLVSGDVHNDGLITATGAGFRPGGGGAIFFRARRLVGAGRIEANGQNWAESFAPAFDWEGAPGSISARLLEDARCGALVTRRGHLPPEVAAYSSWRDAPPGGAVLLQAAALTDCPVLVDDGLSTDKAAWGAPEDFVTLVEHGLVLPGTPLVTAPTEGAALEAERARVSGLATPRAMIVAKLVDLEQTAAPEVVLPRTWADDDGDFSVELPSGLAAGRYALSVHAEVEGLAGPTSEPVSFSVEDATVTALLADAGTPPSRPTVTSPEPDDKVGRRGTTFRGTADPSSWIRVTVGSETLTAVQANGSGNWATSQYQPSATGRQHVKVVASTSKNGGTESEAREFDLDVSIDTPAAPTVTEPGAGAKIGKAGTTFRGSTAPGNVVTVVVDEVPLPGVEADENGDWETVLYTPTSTGRLEVQVTAMNAYENESDATTFEINVSVANVAAPTVISPLANAKVGRSGTVIRGTYVAGTQVKVSVNDQPITSITYDSGSTWMTATFVPTKEGTNTVTATLTDAFGNDSPATTRDFDVKLALPAKPTVTFPLANAKVGQNGTVFRGTREADGQVRVSVNGQAVTPVTTPTTTSWETGTFVPTTAGTNTATVTVTDAYGNSNDTQYSFDVNLTSPPQATVTFPLANAKVGRAGTVFRGTYAAGTEAKVTVGGQVVGPVTYDTATTWSTGTFVPTTAGTNTVTVTVTDSYGNTRDTTHPIDVKLDPPAPPTVTFPLANAKVGLNGTVLRGTREADAGVSISVNGQPVTSITYPTSTTWETGTFVPTAAGANTVTVTVTDGYGNTNSATHPLDVSFSRPQAPTVTFPRPDAKVGRGGTVFRGTNEAGTTVKISVGGQGITPVNADTEDTWSTGSFVPTTAGANTATVTATNAYGNESLPTTLTFDAKLTLPAKPTVTFPLANARVGQAGTVLRGTYETGTHVQVVVEGQEVTPITYDTATTWSTGTFIPTTAGTNTATVTVTDDYGNTNSTTHPLDVRLAPPAAPTVTFPAANAKVGRAGTVLRGTREAGAEVSVSVNGQPVTPITYGTTTTWETGTFVPTLAGTNTVTVTITDSYGNTNSATHPLDVKLDPPAQPSVTFPETDAKVGLAGTLFRGTTEPGTTVRVRVGTQVVAPVTYDTATTWSTGTFVPTTAGTNTVSVIATDEYGNDSATATSPFDVKLTRPPQPTVTFPASGARVGQAGTVFRGTYTTGTVVKVSVGGQAVTPIIYDTATTWSTGTFVPTTAGTNTVSVIVSDDHGNDSSPPVTRSFDVKLSSPAAPTVTSPAALTKVGLAGTILRGTYEAGTTVRVRVNGQEILPVIYDSATTWSTGRFVPATAGINNVVVTATDSHGNEAASAPLPLDVKLARPGKPVPQAPTAGGKVGLAGTQVRGTADVGTTVSVTIGGIHVGDATTNAGQIWDLGLFTNAPAGKPIVHAIATDEYGNVSDPTEFTIDVKITPPAAPIITSPTVIPGTWWVGKAGITVRGTTAVDNAVKLLRETPAGDVTVVELSPSASDTWSAVVSTQDPTKPYLPHGPHVLKAMATDLYGNTSTASNAVPVEVDVVDPEVPVIAYPEQGSWVTLARPELRGTVGAGTTKVRITIDEVEEPTLVTVDGTNWKYTVSKAFAEGEHTVLVSALDGALNESAPSEPRLFHVDLNKPTLTIRAPQEGSVVVEDTPVFQGTVSEQATLLITLDGKTDTVESAGTQWTYRAPPLVDGNSYVFQVIAEDRAGQRSTEKKVAFTVSLAPPGQPTVTLPGNDSWINTNVPTIRGTSDADCTLTLLIDDDVLTSSLRPNLQGNWNYKPTTPLKEGPQTLRVICRDAQNRDSEPSAPVTFRVVTKGPAKPIIVTPAEGDILRRQTFDKIAGTAEPGAIVTAKLNGVDVGSSAVAGPGGDWELEVKLTLNSGTQALVAQAKDRAENLGDESDTRKFVLDFKAPTTTFAEGPSGVVKRTTVTFSLTTSEEVTGFECALDGAAFAPCSTPITFRDLAEGPHFLEVRTTDPAGNVEDPPARRDWTVMRPSTVEGGGVGCAAAGAGVPSVVAWLTWIGLLGLRRQRRR
ncbi:Ig-like domain-containing protein [Myxococcus stipitatus]|uniref:Ig-like domain-containing protein n=1 Tax=Myxococcus stipitatus TaxID=83455 RepID=UPI001F484C8E|nr:Ig-like domain-containing protein [Myxococcus stipitatus]MCE9666964.1 Ig-like domain-containing protein [Myxococcus stipitatus]